MENENITEKETYNGVNSCIRLIKNLCPIIIGLLLLTLPMYSLNDYSDFFRFLGVILIIGDLIYLFFFQYLQNIFISDDEIFKLKIANQVSTDKISPPQLSKNVSSSTTDSQWKGSKSSLISVILLVIIIGSFLFNQFLILKMNSSGISNKLFSISINITKKNGK